MNTRLNKIAIAAALLSGLAAVLPAQAHTAVGATPQDQVIAENVKTALEQAAPFQDKGADVKVSVTNGKVDMSGWLTYANDQGLAESIAQSVPGVTGTSGFFRAWSVDSDARIGIDSAIYQKAGTTNSTAAMGNDAALAQRVKTALLRATPFQDENVDLKVNATNGRVNISGWVGFADDEALARQIAGSVDGVSRVTTSFHAWSTDERP